MPASFQVLLGDGQQAANSSFYEVMTSLDVEENAELPGAIQMTLAVATRGAPGQEDLTVVGDERFKPYARIAVVVSVEGKPDACIFDGYVLSHKVQLDRGTTAASVQVWGQDVSCLMNLEEKTRQWTSSDGNTANTIFGEYGFATATENTDDDSADHPEDRRVLIQRGTDAQFLRDRARRGGKLFRVACGARAGANTGYFVKPKVEGTAEVTLTLNPPSDANLDSLAIEWDVTRPSEVLAQVLGSTVDPIDGGAQGSGLSELDARGLAAFTGQHVTKAMLTTAAEDAGELRMRARALLAEAGWFVRCEGEVDLARLGAVMRVGTLVEVSGAGRLHSGKYLVWSVRHAITAHSHRMKFVLVRNAVGNA